MLGKAEDFDPKNWCYCCCLGGVPTAAVVVEVDEVPKDDAD